MSQPINIILNIIHLYSNFNLKNSKKRKRNEYYDVNPRELKRIKII